MKNIMIKFQAVRVFYFTFLAENNVFESKKTDCTYLSVQACVCPRNFVSWAPFHRFYMSWIVLLNKVCCVSECGRWDRVDSGARCYTQDRWISRHLRQIRVKSTNTKTQC